VPPLLGRRPALILRTAFLVLFVAFLVYATFFARWRPHGLAEVKADLMAFGPSAPAAAVLLQAFGLVLLIPGFLLVLATGLLFGLDGIWISILGQTTGATLAYLVSRHVGRDPLEAVLGQRLLALERALEHRAFRTLVLLRLASVLPGPFLVYAPGLVRVPLRKVALASLLGDLPFIVVVTIIGHTLAHVRDPSELVEPRFLVPLGLLALALATPIVTFLLVRRRRRPSP
jgi:uncharacterized membrane protein YdjX (TVP38/TMEM64 family)